MSGFPQFELASTPLNRGVTLLEASAGTGKTYAIAGIVTRLVAIEGLPISRIVVVTFTDAATAELRSRIRRRLREVLDELLKGSTKDPATEAIRSSGIDLEEAVRRLRLALAAFDEVAISTIHGFCQRALRDNAFEGDAPFDAEIVRDPREALLDVATDFWRRHIDTAAPIVAAALDGEHAQPADLVDLLSRLARHPQLRILPEASTTVDAATRQLESVYATALQRWQRDAAGLHKLLRTSPVLKREKSKALPVDRVDSHAAALARAAETGAAHPAALSAMADFASSRLAALTKANKPTPQHVFFDACEAVSAATRALVASLRQAWLDYAGVEWPKLKASRRMMTFDDLLERMHAALCGPRGEALQTVLRHNYAAALIDEFQDTDPLQYRIFQQAFAVATHWLMYIGDPKQSIYSFRGADLFTYLEAKSAVLQTTPPRIYTLRKNFRSSAAMVDAVNRMFARTPGVFLQTGIEFVDSIADGTKAAAAPLTCAATDERPPLVFVNVPASDGKFTKKRCEPLVYQHIATEIARLLAGTHRLGDRSLQASDIAILVRKHHEGAALQQRLGAQGIRSVRRTNQSVFATPEATALQHLLAAVLEPTRTQTVRTALSTLFFDCDGRRLVDLDTDEAAWETHIESLLEFRQRWQTQDFASAFRWLATSSLLRSRMVQRPGGERSLTNLLHLAELLHDAERTLRLAPSGVQEWLRVHCNAPEHDVEEHVQRLERDDDAVKILTLHNAKGLEYPIVFCPSHWHDADAKECLFHNPDTAQITLDLTAEPPPLHRQLAQEESVAEDIRLLYVGVTRAIHRCYVYGANAADPRNSGLGRVLDGPVDGLLSATIGLRNTEDDAASPSTSPPPVATSEACIARSFNRVLRPEKLVGSFTSLISNASAEAAEDYDDQGEAIHAAARPADAPEDTIFHLPAGAATGIALHSVLEKLDFVTPAALESLVATAFAPLALTSVQHTTVCHHLRELLEHPLQAEDRTLRLNDLPMQARLNEAAFFYPTRAFTRQDLLRVASRATEPGLVTLIQRLNFQPAEGFLNGVVDLIFEHEGRYYLADWKSNWLGNDTAHYAPARLQAVMLREAYVLQSLLYTLALDRHLAARLPDYRYERDFGGIFYIFVRGIDAAHPERGVHFSRPSATFVRELADAVLLPIGSTP
ncbi:MAG: exodeoxyribonuclease V subunit beta [Sinobacteraceae bacterium]|nr:exodeoxyribonuclease V subunit beta [Nevskiaceae bacterium]